ncbi:MAG: hypothetical protein AAFQ33_09680, partial [Pseudomonadota bacterium]
MKRALVLLATTALTGPALAEPDMTYDEALACVERVVPAETYVTNDLLPSDADLSDITPMDETVRMRLGLSWILDDAHSQFYNAIEE